MIGDCCNILDVKFLYFHYEITASSTSTEGPFNFLIINGLVNFGVQIIGLVLAIFSWLLYRTVRLIEFQ